MIAVRAFAPADWRCQRDIRLAALADAPDAFGSTLERERAFDDATWQSRVAESSAKVTFGAWLNDVPVGLAHGQLDTECAGRAWLMAMWVRPSARRQGIGQRLVDAVVAWSAERGARVIYLQVSEGNRAAESLYAGAGFRPTGEIEPLRPRSSRNALTYERALR